MPITLNHSNINVQYSSDKSYIIETVKSDLYRRNENVDTVIRNNIQTAPVTPTTYVDSSGNVYAVESYTYSGTANTADYTRVFPKNTTCDILIVGGGGGGGFFGGGGGGGNILFATNFTLNAGNYNIKVGKGGVGSSSETTNGTNGENSSIIINSIEYIAKGGGGGGSRQSSANGNRARNGNDGGSGGGGSGSNDAAVIGVGGVSNKNTYTNWLSYGNNGGNGRQGISGSEPIFASGGGGGAGSAGQNISLITGGGNGGTGMSFVSTFGTSVGHNGWFAGGGGGNTYVGSMFGYGNGGNGLFGGGGDGGNDWTSENPAKDGLPNTGGGGGGSKFDGGVAADNDGGSGGSGIVIIKYLLGTIPTTNFLTNEPVVTAPIFTESIRTFVHSGGTEAQTTYNITVPQNTICDILMIGGGGSGGVTDAGGGGAGACIVAINQTLSAGTYTIRVGKGGEGGSLSSTSVFTKLPTNGSNSSILNQQGNEIFRAVGGGRAGGAESSGDYTLSSAFVGKVGGCGGGAGFYQGYNATSGGSASTLNIVNGVSNIGPSVTSTYGVYGNSGGSAQQWTNGNYSTANCGGGGGIGTAGASGTASTNRSGVGGNGLNAVTINAVTYNFSTHFTNGGVFGVGGYIGGGGGGGGFSNSPAKISGGLGGGGTGDCASNNTVFSDAPTDGAPNTGSGGGGGCGNAGANGGNGGSGIVVIKFKSIAPPLTEGNPITHKTLNFTYVPNYPIIQADTTNLKAWYKFDGNYNDSSSSGFNLTNSGAEIVDGLIEESLSTDGNDFLQTSGINLNGKTYSLSFWLKFNTTPSTTDIHIFSQGTTAAPGLTLVFLYQSNYLRFSHYGSGNDMDTSGYNISSMIGTSWHHYVITYNNTNRGAEIWFDGVKLNTNISTLTNAFTGSGSFTIARWGSTFNGLMEDFRYYDKVLTSTEISQLYSIPTTNQYTLNFPVPTLTDINNNSNIVLRGAYDISLSTINSLIIPKEGQYIPKLTTFASDLLSIRYNILNPTNDPIGAQWVYNTSNINVYTLGNVGIGTTNPQYTLDVSGSVNAKSYYLNGRQINEPLSELGLSEGMIAQVRHLTYTQMDVKNNTGWDAINDNLTTGFVIAITPKSNLSKILVNIIVHIGLAASNYSVWWGIKLYRKIGTGNWTEVTGPNGTETGSAAELAGTPVWISYTMYGGDLDYQYKVANVTGTYLDSPNTTSTVYYTAYWNNKLIDNPSAINTIYLNRAESHGDAYRPAPSSSWTASEIWYG